MTMCAVAINALGATLSGQPAKTDAPIRETRRARVPLDL
jgi:hypothetical protein